MVLEVMGRYAGWIAIYAGVAGGADVVLIPEIPFTYDSICDKISGTRGCGQALHPRHYRRGCERKGASSSRPPIKWPTAKPDWAASRPWCLPRSSGAPAKRPAPACWGICNEAAVPQISPCALLGFRRGGGGTDCRRQVRANGGLSGLSGDGRADYRSGRPFEDRAAHGRFCPHGSRAGDLPRRLGGRQRCQ